jgi:DNA-binding transcriptional LysR family regulator
VIRIGRLADASFVARKLSDDRLVIAGAPSYLARAGRPRAPDDLSAHNCLHYEILEMAAEWRFRTVTPSVKGNFTANDGTVLREATVAGLGLVVIPFFMVARDVVAGRLELVLEGTRKAELGIYAVLAAARGQPLRVRTLVEHLQAWFSRPTWRIDDGPPQGGGTSATGAAHGGSPKRASAARGSVTSAGAKKRREPRR